MPIRASPLSFLDLLDMSLCCRMKRKDFFFLSFPHPERRGALGVRGLTRSSFFLEQGQFLIPCQFLQANSVPAGLLLQPYLSCAWQG